MGLCREMLLKMAAENAALSGLTVLIIEDEFLIAADVQHIVEEAGAAVALLASSISSARQLLAGEQPIDVCILDLKLGSEDGFPLAQEFRESGMPFVVATGLEGDLELPGVVVVQKPYDAAQVVDALLRALAAR